MPVDPWMIDTLTYSGSEARNADAMLVMSDGTALGSRGGVRPGDPGLTVTLAGSIINVSAGVAAVSWPGQGIYRVPFPASVSPGSLAAAHATLGRVDLVYLRVWDTAVDGSGLAQGDIVYLAGTPSSTPAAPTPSGTVIYLPLATISVPSVAAGGPPVVSTAVRPATVAPGGILPSATAPSSPYVGQYYDSGMDLLRWNGTSWDTYVRAPTWTAYTPTWTASGTAPVLGNGTLLGRYVQVGSLVTVHINLTSGSSTTYGSGTLSFGLPVMAAAVGASWVMTAQLLGSDRWGGQAVVGPGANNTTPFMTTSATNGRLASMTASVPETLTSGAQVRITGSYEAA